MRNHLTPVWVSAPTPAPSPHHNWAPSPSNPEFLQSSTESNTTSTSTSSSLSSPPPSKLPVEFTPPLIAMVVIIVAAFLVITYSRLISRQFVHIHRRYLRWRHRRRRYVPSSAASNIESPPYPFDATDAFHVFSPYGLDDAAIKTIPLSIHTRRSGGGGSGSPHDCAVCLLEFQQNDYVRTLPVCSHTFHVDCIDIWLKSHANCPLCRAGIFRPESPFVPVMAARIRPSLDEMIMESTILEPLTEIVPEPVGEITQELSPRRNVNAPLSEERLVDGRDFLLKRSYSFGFERNLGSERLVLEPVTASPWRYRRGGGGSFWSKRPSPFSSLTKPRVFSFRYYRGTNMKSPFFRRRGGVGIGGGSFYPLSESSARYGGGSTSAGGGGSSRRSNKSSFASPMFMRTSAGGGGGGLFSSSRQRSGDPEALLSPDRYNKR